MRQGRGSEVTEAAICLKGKYASSYRMGIQRVIWFSWSVCPSVCVCVTFVVFPDCESGTRPISITSESMEVDVYRLAHGTFIDTRRGEVGPVAKLLWISWCGLRAAGFRVYFYFFHSNAHGLLLV